MRKPKSLRDNKDLKVRLAEAEELLVAIKSGAVDALVTDDQKIFTLKGADSVYRVLVESMNEGAVTLAFEGTVMYCNKFLSKILGFSIKRIIGSSIFDFVAPDEISRFKSILRQSKKRNTRSEFRFKKNDKTFFPVLVSCNSLKHQDARLCMVITDLTELESAKRLSDIGVLAATVAHELRNPLASIELSAYHIKRTTKDPRIEGDISSIKKCLSESDQIINNILLYSKLKTSCLRAVKINNILKECIDEAKGRFPRKNIAINVKTDLIKDLSIRVDSLQIKEVFNNILNNAFDAFNKNSGIIDIESQVNDSTVSILIKDNGEGIEKKHLDKIFDPFFTTKTQGTGLGLAVCNLAIKLHHGLIVIESDKAKGTTVIVTLPIGKQKDA